jgi:hypothetical protein
LDGLNFAETSVLKEVSGVTIFVDYMIDKYKRKDVTVGFKADIKRLLKILNKRIQVEEKLLFPDYEKDNGKTLLKKLRKWFNV